MREESILEAFFKRGRVHNLFYSLTTKMAELRKLQTVYGGQVVGERKRKLLEPALPPERVV